MLKTLAGLIEPVGGSLSIAGGPPGGQPARVGYLAQRPASSYTLPICAADVLGRVARIERDARIRDSVGESATMMRFAAVLVRRLRYRLQQ